MHEIKATTLGADSIRFKAELQFNGAEVAARYHAQRRDMVEQLRTLQQVRALLPTPAPVRNGLIGGTCDVAGWNDGRARGVSQDARRCTDRVLGRRGRPAGAEHPSRDA